MPLALDRTPQPSPHFAKICTFQDMESNTKIEERVIRKFSPIEESGRIPVC